LGVALRCPKRPFLFFWGWPFRREVCPLQLLSEYQVVDEESQAYDLGPPFMYLFHANFANMTAAHQLGDWPEHFLFLLQGLEYTSGFRCASRQTLLPWRLWKQGLPEPAERQPAAASARGEGAELREEMVAQFPWLAKTLDTQGGFAQGESRGSRAARRQASQESAAEADLDAEAMVAALAELDSARQEVHDVLPRPPAALGWRIDVLGGKWTLEHRGRAYDAVQGHARGPEALDFCRRRALQKSMRFSTADFGLELAHLLARAYVSRMEYAFGLEQAGTVGPFEPFTVDHWRLYEEPDELRAVLAQNPLRLLHKRVAELRRLLAPP